MHKIWIFFCWLNSFSDIFALNISRMATPKSISYTIFWKDSIRSFWCVKNFAQNCDYSFRCHQKKNTKKWAIYDILITLSSNLWVLFHSFPPPFCIICYSLCMPKMTLSSLLTQTSFLYIEFANFRYIICLVLNLMPMWPQSKLN